MKRSIYKVLLLSVFVLLVPSGAVFAGKGGPSGQGKEPGISVSSVGYAAYQGLISYGGKTFALWLAGSNPATATALLVGIAGGKIAGMGFEQVTRYLKSQNITPPSAEEIQALIEEFEVMDIDEENYDDIPEIRIGEDGEVAAYDSNGNIVNVSVFDFDNIDDLDDSDEDIPEIHIDENGEMAAYDQNGAEVAIGVIEEQEELGVLAQAGYIDSVQQFAQYTFLNFVRGLPRMGATMIPGAIASAVANMLGGSSVGAMMAAASNAAASNLTGQVYDLNVINVVVLSDDPEPIDIDSFEFLDIGEGEGVANNNNNVEVITMPVVSLIEEQFELLSINDNNNEVEQLPATRFSIIGSLSKFF